MSDLPIEIMEPATSLPNDETVKTEAENRSASLDSMIKDAANGTNGSTKTEGEVKEDVKEEVIKENGSSAKPKAEESPKKPRQRTYEDGVLKTSALEVEGKRNNSKYDPSVLPVTDDHAKIHSQVEFYFGDTNLPTDDYMWKLTGGAENLPVPIETICAFGRMKRFQPASAVVAALTASKFLEVIGEEGHEKVKRRHAFDPTLPKSAIEARSIYAKGFGDEDAHSQFDIEAFFATYGPTNCVRLRRTDNKLFKGSVFVEFENEELAKKFLELDPKPLWKGVHILKVQSKTAYIEAKAQEIRDGKVEPKVHRGRGGQRGNNRGRGENRDRGDRGRNERGGRGDRDPDDWKKRREEDRASGFKDNRRNDRGDRKGSNRGGRGGGRRDREDRGPRNNDRNREREEKNKGSKVDGKDGEREVKSEKTEIKADSPKNEKKRAREDDDVEPAPSKKVDIKPEVAAAS